MATEEEGEEEEEEKNPEEDEDKMLIAMDRRWSCDVRREFVGCSFDRC